MARKKGSAAKASFGKPGQMKTDLIRIRVSQEWLDVFHTVTKNSWWHKDKTRSDIIRIMCMQGLLGYCDTDEHRQMVQTQIENT